MNKSKLILIITVFFNLSLSWGADTCTPVAQFSHVGKLKPNTVTFSKWTTKLDIPESQINTAKCKKINKTLSPDKYKLLKDLSTSKQPVLAIMGKVNENQNSYCLMDVLVPDSVFSQQWITQDDPCTQQNLVKVIFKGNRQSFYFTKDQIQLLSSRKPERSRPRR